MIYYTFKIVAGLDCHIVKVEHHEAVQVGVFLVTPAFRPAFVYCRLPFIEVGFYLGCHEEKHGKRALDFVRLVNVAQMHLSAYHIDRGANVMVSRYFPEFFAAARNTRSIRCLLIVKH